MQLLLRLQLPLLVARQVVLVVLVVLKLVWQRRLRSGRMALIALVFRGRVRPQGRSVLQLRQLWLWLLLLLLLLLLLQWRWL